MARFYVPLDVNYQLDDKIMCAGHVAECLYVRALAYAKRSGSEGTIMHSQLRALALGLPGQPGKHAATLVEVGLWEELGNEYYINAWLNHNLTNAQIAEQKATMRRKSIAANHKRHHSLKGVIDDDCELCNPPTGDEQRSHVGDEKLPKEEEEKRNQDETNTKRKESSSAVGELHSDPLKRDDDDFVRAINIVVEHKAWIHRPDNRLAWEITVVPNTITELGQIIRAELDAGNTSLHAAGVALGSQRKAELAAGRIK